MDSTLLFVSILILLDYRLKELQEKLEEEVKERFNPYSIGLQAKSLPNKGAMQG